MKAFLWPLVMAAIVVLPSATSDGPICPDESEQTVNLPTGEVYYVAEKTYVTISGDIGLYSLWEEANSIPGLQTGGLFGNGKWFPPGCDQTPFEDGDAVWSDSGLNPGYDPVGWVTGLHFNPGGDKVVPCVIFDEWRPHDECGSEYGPDRYIV